LHNCSENATCTNTDGGFTCECNDAYQGNGIICTDINECENNPCLHGICNNLINDYSCDCEEGYTGKNCDICDNGYQDNDDNQTCLPNCNTAALNCNHGVCNDQLGEALCICDTGYAGESCNQCANNYHDEDGICVANNCQNGDTDIIECQGGNGIQEVECVNYEWVNNGDCICNDGYHLSNSVCIEDSCNDGIKNQDETDIDCGGSCGSCCGNGRIDTAEECDYADTSTWDSSCENVFGEGYQGIITCNTCTENIENCYQSIVINEIMTGNGSGWIEIYNKGTNSVDISGWHITTLNHSFIVSQGVTIDADDYYVINNLNIETQDAVEITDSSSNEVDYIDWTSDKTLYGRYENGEGDFTDLTIPTPHEPNILTSAVDIVWCDVKYPQNYTALMGETITVYGQVYGEINGTQQTGHEIESVQIRAKVCYLDNGNEICKSALYNENCDSCGNNDEYMSDLSINTEGNYQYYYKFSGDMGYSWIKCTQVGGNEYTAQINSPGVDLDGYKIDLYQNGESKYIYTLNGYYQHNTWVHL